MLIHMRFYEPVEEDKNLMDRWINKTIRNYDPPFTHCDVQFADGMASSVFQFEMLYWKQRKFTKPGYRCVTMSVDESAYCRAYRLCQ